jgi:hypothetical protein
MALHTASIGIPERFEIDDHAGALRIQWKWPRLVALPLVFFSVAWDGFLVGWYVDVLEAGTHSLAMMLFPIAHVAVGLVLPYVALSVLMNSTFIEIVEGQLSVDHRPLPFPGRRRLRAADVRQLFCVERKSRKGAISYDVMARLTSDKEVRLVPGLPSEREARFIEQRIENRLGIANRPVAGELP